MKLLIDVLSLKGKVPSYFIVLFFLLFIFFCIYVGESLFRPCSQQHSTRVHNISTKCRISQVWISWFSPSCLKQSTSMVHSLDLPPHTETLALMHTFGMRISGPLNHNQMGSRQEKKKIPVFVSEGDSLVIGFAMEASLTVMTSREHQSFFSPSSPLPFLFTFPESP